MGYYFLFWLCIAASMSHKKLRQEKNCLNCGETVEDRFCSHCGQENLELKDTATHLMLHYVQDLFHYDGKLWHTLKSLVTRPGLVAKEYMEGKRQVHLEPIRFYVFASTVFFLIFFFVLGSDLYTSNVAPASNYTKRLYHLKQEKDFLKGHPDTMAVNQLITSLRNQAGDTIPDIKDSLGSEVEIELFDVPKDTTSDMGWLEKMLTEKVEAKTEELEAKHDGDEAKATSALLAEIIHTLPQLIFLSLPFFAFFLKLLYWRSRRSAYVEHFIFSIYHYAYLFSILLFYLLLDRLTDKLEWAFIDTIETWLVLAMFLYPFVYLFLSMKRFYNDGGVWLLFRFITLMFLLGFTILMLFLVFVVFTFLF